MGNNGDDVRELELATWRAEIRRMMRGGERLSIIEDRLEKAELSETERFLLRAVARAQAGQSGFVDRYRDSFTDSG